MMQVEGMSVGKKMKCVARRHGVAHAMKMTNRTVFKNFLYVMEESAFQANGAMTDGQIVWMDQTKRKMKMMVK
jgi:hypothetical protein